MDLNETWNISEGPRCTLTQKMGKFTQRIPPKGDKGVLFFSVTQPMQLFRLLILHQFRPSLKQKMWIGVHMHTPMKNFQIFAQGFPDPKTAKNW